MALGQPDEPAKCWQSTKSLKNAPFRASNGRRIPVFAGCDARSYVSQATTKLSLSDTWRSDFARADPRRRRAFARGKG